MKKVIPTFFVVTIFFIVSLSAYADQVHKWVDEKGVTHYSDKAPTSSTTQITLIEVPAKHTSAIDVEKDYYSITNQWMRIHEERLEREKIKLERAKLKAVQRPPTPQVVYLNEPNEDRYVVGYPYFYHRKHKYYRNRHGSNKHYGDKHAKHNRSGRMGKSHRQRHGSHSRRSSSGLTLRLH